MLDVAAEVVAVVDLVPVEVLVLERTEGAFADAVLTQLLSVGADVDQLRVRVDEGREARRHEARPVMVVGDGANQPGAAPSGVELGEAQCQP